MVFFFPQRMDFIIRHFAITGWKRVLYAFIFILLCWQLSRFWGNWKDGVSSVFYVIHAPIHEVGHTVAAMIHLPQMAVVLAGSVFQLLTPIAIGVYFVWHGDCPALSLCLGWLGFQTATISSMISNICSPACIALTTHAVSAWRRRPSATHSYSSPSPLSSPCSS